jgi:hypothetical protein
MPGMHGLSSLLLHIGGWIAAVLLDMLVVPEDAWMNEEIGKVPVAGRVLEEAGG